MDYRSKSYFKYLGENLGHLRRYLIMSLLVSLIYTAAIIIIGISEEELAMSLMIAVIIFIFQIVGLSIFKYVIPRSWAYRLYRRSGRQFYEIRNYITGQFLDIDVVTEATKLSFTDSLNFIGNKFSDIDYKFDKADIFTTEHSIFIFPFVNINVDSKVFHKEFKPTIRFKSNPNELFPSLTNIHAKQNFEYTLENDDVVLKFKDKNVPADVTIRLKNYNR